MIPSTSVQQKAKKWLARNSAHEEFPGISPFFGVHTRADYLAVKKNPPSFKFDINTIVLATPFESLHGWILGCPKRACTFVIPLLKLNLVRKAKLSIKAATIEYNRRVRLFLSSKVMLSSGEMRYIPRFGKASEFNGFRAMDYRFLSQMLISVFMDVDTFFEPVFGNKFRAVIVRMHSIGCLLYDGKPWTTIKTRQYDELINDFGQMFYEVFHLVSKSDCRFIKTHCLGEHLMEDADEYGCHDAVSAETFESTHKEYVKQAFAGTNGAKIPATELRMLRNAQRRQLVRSATATLSAMHEIEDHEILVPEEATDSNIVLTRRRGTAFSKYSCLVSFNVYHLDFLIVLVRIVDPSASWIHNAEYTHWKFVNDGEEDWFEASTAKEITHFQFATYVEDWFETEPPINLEYSNRWNNLLGESNGDIQVTFFSCLHLPRRGITYHSTPHYFGNDSSSEPRPRYDIVAVKPGDEETTKEDCWFGELLHIFHISGAAGGEFCFIRYFQDVKKSPYRDISPFRHMEYELKSQKNTFAVIPATRLSESVKPYFVEDSSTSAKTNPHRRFFAFWFY
jgi:hypothetical protein